MSRRRTQKTSKETPWHGYNLFSCSRPSWAHSRKTVPRTAVPSTRTSAEEAWSQCFKRPRNPSSTNPSSGAWRTMVAEEATKKTRRRVPRASGLAGPRGGFHRRSPQNPLACSFSCRAQRSPRRTHREQGQRPKVFPSKGPKIVPLSKTCPCLEQRPGQARTMGRGRRPMVGKAPE